jgi:hypothetical protein
LGKTGFFLVFTGKKNVEKKLDVSLVISGSYRKCKKIITAGP